jgi:hypothetical protein
MNEKEGGSLMYTLDAKVFQLTLKMVREQKEEGSGLFLL